MDSNAKAPVTVGVIGGTGLYEIGGFEEAQWVQVASSFGSPSDDLLIGEVEGGVRLVFLPRHGRGHRIPPSEVNYRANIDVLKRAGVTAIISFSAVGSLREDIKPGEFLIVDQYIDRTNARERSFFGKGFVAHVSMADPTCRTIGAVIESAGRDKKLPVHAGGVYITIEGPQFSTRAESHLYRSWGCDVIGMTSVSEARLAREAEICYNTVAMVTDYDCWRSEHESVSAKAILDVLHDNSDVAHSLLMGSLQSMAVGLRAPCPSGCHSALEHAVATARDMRDPAVMKRLSAVAGRVADSPGW